MRKKIFFVGEKKTKRQKIFGEGKYFVLEEKKNGGNNERRTNYLFGGEGKGGKYLEKGKQIGGEKNREGKGGKCLEEGKTFFFVEEMKNGDGKGGKYHGEGKIVADW